MADERNGIIVLGGINIDLVMRVPKVPVEGETVKGLDFTETPGGKGANQAVACARLGGNVKMLGKVGNDAFSEQMLGNLRKADIDTCFIDRAETYTGVALIMVDEKGANIISFAPGANGLFSAADIDKNEELFRRSRVLLIQNECTADSVFHAIKKASDNGAGVIYNPAPAVPMPDEITACCDVIVPNESEAESLTGIKIDTEESMRRAAGYFLERGCGTVIITLGSRGAYYKNKAEEGLVPAPSVKAVDTVGAGDVFLGAFTVEYEKGSSLTDSIKFAVHAASLSVTKPGAQTSIPDIEVLNKNYPFLRSEK